jgi:hypothetical protein
MRSDYADAILALDPVVYYQMEPSGDGAVLKDSSKSGADAQIHKSAAACFPWTGGKVGAALELKGPAEQTFAVADDYPKATENQLSVIAWVYAESRPQWASIAKNWGDEDELGQFHFGLRENSGELAVHIVDTSKKSDEFVNKALVWAQDTTPLPLHAWHHVAMVAEGTTLRLYRNGQEVGSTPYTTLHQNPSLRKLAIGAKLNDCGDAPAKATENPGWSMWDGRLDELAIFNKALTPEQIRHLYELSSDGS